MTVAIHMHGNLRRFLPDGRDRMELDVAPGTTVEGLLGRLGAAADVWLVAIDGARVERERLLEAGDRLDCFEPVAGG